MKVFKRINNESILIPITIHSCISEDDYHKLKAEENYKWGKAIDKNVYFHTIDKKWFVSNGEYCSIIKFCPYYGIELKLIE